MSRARLPLIRVEVSLERDVVLARQRARHVAAVVGLDGQAQTRMATAVSEIARNAFRYGKGGRVELFLQDGQDGSPPQLCARVSDQGGGIADVDAVLGGHYVSQTGMGLGIIGSKRLMDSFELATSASGTTVVFGKALPRGAGWPSAEQIAQFGQAIAEQAPESPFAEVQQQNQELLRAMAEIREREVELEARGAELRRLNDELAVTNRGVIALYVELEEQMTQVSRSAQQKLRFLSDVSHEIRTPINAILGLSELVLGSDTLVDDDKHALVLLRRSAVDLSALVDDLLDSAKLEAGRAEVRVEQFTVDDLFSSVRGTFLAIHKRQEVALTFKEDARLPSLSTDRGKLAQILRNLVANALKFTEYGTVAVRALAANEHIVLSVGDTGIGIAPEDHARIFEEYAQVDSSVQRRVRGTGLGLPIARRLARLLGGDLTVEAEPGAGSVFTLTVPIVYSEPIASPDSGAVTPAPPSSLGPQSAHTGARTERPILIIDDDPASRRTCKEELARLGHALLLEAEDGATGLRIARGQRPSVIVLDFNLPDCTGADVLDQLARDQEICGVPVIVRTARHVSAEERASSLKRAAAVLSKGATGVQSLAALREALLLAGLGVALPKAQT